MIKGGLTLNVENSNQHAGEELKEVKADILKDKILVSDQIKGITQWNLLHSKLVNSIGADDDVIVKDMAETSPGHYLIDVVVNNCMKALSLAMILVPEHHFGKNVVKIRVLTRYDVTLSPEFVPEEDPVSILQQIFKFALYGNSYVREVKNISPQDNSGVRELMVVLAPAIIQFKGGNHGDFFGNYNEVASKVFSELVKKDYPGNIHVSIVTENVCLE